MSLPRPGRTLGAGGAALAVFAIIGLGFTAPPQEEQLPTVRVWHDPT